MTTGLSSFHNSPHPGFPAELGAFAAAFVPSRTDPGSCILPSSYNVNLGGLSVSSWAGWTVDASIILPGPIILGIDPLKFAAKPRLHQELNAAGSEPQAQRAAPAVPLEAPATSDNPCSVFQHLVFAEWRTHQKQPIFGPWGSFQFKGWANEENAAGPLVTKAGGSCSFLGAPNRFASGPYVVC